MSRREFGTRLQNLTIHDSQNTPKIMKVSSKHSEINTNIHFNSRELNAIAVQRTNLFELLIAFSTVSRR